MEARYRLISSCIVTFFSDISIDLSRKHLLEAMWNGELKDELQHRELTEELYTTKHQSREVLMKTVDEMRRSELYPHPPENCSEECRSRGVSHLLYIVVEQITNKFNTLLFCIKKKLEDELQHRDRTIEVLYEVLYLLQLNLNFQVASTLHLHKYDFFV